MKLLLKLEKEDAENLRYLFGKYENHPDVLIRIKRLEKPLELSKENIWKQIITCLVTSQQRSGKNSKVGKFLRIEPFPLSYQKCLNQNNLQSYASTQISQNGLRFRNRIPRYIVTNLSKLEKYGWGELDKLFDNITSSTSNRKEVERIVAGKIGEMLKGFGPKQSRHLLLGLGLAKYEIPIDSRILKWIDSRLKEGYIPTQALSNERFFCFILDKFHELCREADMLPAVADVLLFVDADNK